MRDVGYKWGLTTLRIGMLLGESESLGHKSVLYTHTYVFVYIYIYIYIHTCMYVYDLSISM